ncbi:beta-glucuronidase [bacterium]|nr:MAG: beta-glucuronidase [bacterium]
MSLIKRSTKWVLLSLMFAQFAWAQSGQKTTLNGQWQVIVDPFDNGYFSYRLTPRTDGFFQDKKPSSPRDLIEYEFNNSHTLQVPGDWNSQREDLFFYEGTVWYKKDFTVQKSESNRYFIQFDAVNYIARVYLNGKKLGEHEGGFTPFEFDVSDVIQSGKNTLVVYVNNDRHPDYVPTVNTDWWNYGGITRDVNLVVRPQTYISDVRVELSKDGKNIAVEVALNGDKTPENVEISFPEFKLKTAAKVTGNKAMAEFKYPKKAKRWDIFEPNLYEVKVTAGNDVFTDKVGFRTIETKDQDILLNGKSILLKGISIHEEAPLRDGRAYTEDDARVLLEWAKDLGCNYVRLAHYPHNEHMVRIADEMGLLVWSEIPVYWTINWESEITLNNAKNQLAEMIERDKNRASVIIWSVANETPRGEARLDFLKALIAEVKAHDKTRLVSAATELSHDGKVNIIDDTLGYILDVIGLNEYYGWYGGNPENMHTISFNNTFNKPLVISEFGAGALQGHRGEKDQRWTEDYQVNVYENQIANLQKIPSLRGMSPWILKDFKSPRRPLYGIQDWFNRKGLISERGQKKAAFYVLRDFYNEWNLK